MRGAICLKAACGAANLSPFRLIHTEPAVNSRLIKPYISSAMEEKTVGFQGIQGAYSESAAEGLFRSSQHLKHVRPIFKGYQTFNQTFEALKKREIDYAIIPIENSSTGTFLWNFDLMHNFDAHIVGEYCIHESHCLVALPGVKIEDLKEIRSHPYVIDQCQLFLSDAGKHLSVSQALDTAGSASYIKEKNLKDVGAIAGKKAAEIYGLSILKENVEDKQNTITR
ncbi:prephenate dehydrogenase (NADP(+)) [Clydaea vesicula]|uniref:Prephenate dehydrogenase (NADP(+)) n=1 Tax=Clydaea vesicula TaxID=447962 RepID=A0AAD5UBB2_9FUNG|nr:prephenate dehydrogenase (NADP(+)) [Clydaea vesicula]